MVEAEPVVEAGAVALVLVRAVVSPSLFQVKASAPSMPEGTTARSAADPITGLPKDRLA